MSSEDEYEEERVLLRHKYGEEVEKKDDDRVLRRLRGLRVPQLESLFSMQAMSPDRGSMRRTRYAAEFIHLAVEKRRPRFEQSHPTELLVMRLMRSLPYKAMILSCILFLCIMVIWEPVSSYQRAINSSIFFAELSLLLVFVADILLDTFAHGISGFVEKRWNIIYALLITSMILELLIVYSIGRETTIRALRPLRSLLLLCHYEPIRRTMKRILFSIPNTFPVLALLIVFAGAYAITGVAVLKGDYGDKLNEYRSVQNFDSFFHGILAMLILSTTENYPAVLVYGYDNHPVFSSIFFISFLMIASWVLMALLMATIFDYFRREHMLSVSQGRVKEHLNLLLAFRLLEYDGFLRRKRFVQLLKAARPTFDDDRCSVLFHLLDADKDGRLSEHEFLSLIDVMHSTMTPLYGKPSLFGCIRRIFGSRRVETLYKSKLFSRASAINALLNVLFLILHAQGLVLSYSYSALNWVCLFVVVIECLIGIGAVGLGEYAKQNPFNLVLLSISLPIELCGDLGYLRISVVEAVRGLRVLRIAFVIQSFRTVVFTLLQTVDILAELLAIFGVITYFFALLGMELFGMNHVAADPTDQLENFSSFEHALFALFQISTTNNWNDVMYSVINKSSVFYSIYFVVYYFLVCLVILNILATLVITTYTNVLQASAVQQLSFTKEVLLPGATPKAFRAYIRRNYNRAIIEEEYPAFNEEELDQLDECIRHINQKMDITLVKAEINVPKSELSSKQLLAHKLLNRRPSIHDMEAQSLSTISVPDNLLGSYGLSQ